MNKQKQVIDLLERWVVIHLENPETPCIQAVIGFLRQLAQTEARTEIAFGYSIVGC